MAKISWSTLKLGLECPRKLQYSASKTSPSEIPRTYHTSLGTVVQFIFELYYKKGVFKVPHGPNPATLQQIVTKVFASSWFTERAITFGGSNTREEFEKQVREQAEAGRKQLEILGLLDKPVRTEEYWNVKWRGNTLVGMLDFVYEPRKKVLQIFDGKGHQQKNAEEGQLKFYAAMALLRGMTVEKMGFMYWRHGFEEHNYTPEQLKAFLDTEVTSGIELIGKARSGMELEAKPEAGRCGYCPWKRSCPASVYFEAGQRQPEGLVTF